jgi:hypothetical protein
MVLDMMKVFFPRMIDYDSISASCSKPGHRGSSDPCTASLTHSHIKICIYIHIHTHVHTYTHTRSFFLQSLNPNTFPYQTSSQTLSHHGLTARETSSECRHTNWYVAVIDCTARQLSHITSYTSTPYDTACVV